MPLRLSAAQAPSETHAAPQECQRKSRKKKFKYTSWYWWLDHQTDMLLEGAGHITFICGFHQMQIKALSLGPHTPNYRSPAARGSCCKSVWTWKQRWGKEPEFKELLSSEVIWPHATNWAKSIGWDKETSSRACCTQQPTPEAWFHLLGGRSLQCCWTCSLAQDIDEVLRAVNIIGLVEAHW